MRLSALLLVCLSALPVSAFTADQLTAIHSALNEPYRLQTYTIDGNWREAVAEDMRFRNPALVQEVMRAAAGPFDGARIHVYTQTDTSLVSEIVGLEMGGEIVLIAWHSTAFFEIPDLTERRIALLDAVGQAFAPGRLAPGWAEQTFGNAIETARAYADGARGGRFAGWSYSNSGGVQVLGQSAIPDWVAITITTLDCAPRYPLNGWALLYMCPDG